MKFISRFFASPSLQQGVQAAREVSQVQVRTHGAISAFFYIDYYLGLSSFIVFLLTNLRDLFFLKYLIPDFFAKLVSNFVAYLVEDITSHGWVPKIASLWLVVQGAKHIRKESKDTVAKKFPFFILALLTNKPLANFVNPYLGQLVRQDQVIAFGLQAILGGMLANLKNKLASNGFFKVLAEMLAAYIHISLLAGVNKYLIEFIKPLLSPLSELIVKNKLVGLGLNVLFWSVAGNLIKKYASKTEMVGIELPHTLSAFMSEAEFVLPLEQFEKFSKYQISFEKPFDLPQDVQFQPDIKAAVESMLEMMRMDSPLTNSLTAIKHACSSAVIPDERSIDRQMVVIPENQNRLINGLHQFNNELVRLKQEIINALNVNQVKEGGVIANYLGDSFFRAKELQHEIYALQQSQRSFAAIKAEKVSLTATKSFLPKEAYIDLIFACSILKPEKVIDYLKRKLVKHQADYLKVTQLKQRLGANFSKALSLKRSILANQEWLARLKGVVKAPAQPIDKVHELLTYGKKQHFKDCFNRQKAKQNVAEIVSALHEHGDGISLDKLQQEKREVMQEIEREEAQLAASYSNAKAGILAGTVGFRHHPIYSSYQTQGLTSLIISLNLSWQLGWMSCTYQAVSFLSQILLAQQNVLVKLGAALRVDELGIANYEWFIRWWLEFALQLLIAAVFIGGPIWPVMSGYVLGTLASYSASWLFKGIVEMLGFNPEQGVSALLLSIISQLTYAIGFNTAYWWDDINPASRMSCGQARSTLGFFRKDYETGISESSIKTQYKRLSLASHPDKGGSDLLMADINEARDVLLACGGYATKRNTL